MQATLETVQAEVMRLSPADRAKLLDSLIASLDIDADAEAAWDELADTREHDLETGAAQAIPLDVAVARFLDQIEFALIESSFSTRQCGLGRTMN